MLNDKQIVIVIGCPRSGTTLMQSQLAKYFNFAALMETHFIPVFNKYLYLWNYCQSIKSRIKLLDAINEFTKIRWVIGSGYTLSKITEASILATLDNQYIIASQANDYSSLIEHLFFRYADLHNSIGVVEKFSYYNPVNTLEITKLLPNAKFIHVIRDGRDVSLSWQSTWFGPTSITEAALLWKKQLLEYRKLQNIIPNGYIEIKYEDLLCNQALVLDKIGSFFGKKVSYDICGFNNINFETLAEKEHYKKAAQSLDSSNLSKWPRLMPEKDVALFENIAGDLLKINNYPVSIVDSDKLIANYKHVDAMRYKASSISSATKWKRRIMNKLPPLIWLSQRFKLSPYLILSRIIKNQRI